VAHLAVFLEEQAAQPRVAWALRELALLVPLGQVPLQVAHLVAFLEAPAALPQAAWVLRDRALLQVAHPVVFLAELQAKALAKTLAKTLASLE
jgi:hypothetical protein